MTIKKLEKWLTDDGKEHYTHAWATEWDARIEAAAKATEMLESGESVATCLQSLEYPPEIDPILHRVTKDTKLVISHWQCQDTPGYQVRRFLTDGRVVVYGDAGAWSGPYGNDITITNLTRYAKDKRNTQLTAAIAEE